MLPRRNGKGWYGFKEGYNRQNESLYVGSSGTELITPYPMQNFNNVQASSHFSGEP